MGDSIRMFVLAVLLFPCSLFASGDPEFCEALFPGKNVIDYNQGTVELWYKLNYQLEDRFDTGDKSYVICLTMFSTHASITSLEPPEYDRPSLRLRMSYKSTGQSLGIDSTMFDHSFKKAGSLFVRADKLGFTKDNESDWHYLAVTWEKKADVVGVKVYFDGKFVTSKDMPFRKSVSMKNPSKEKLRFGDVTKSYGSLDSLRISQRVRSEEEIQKAFSQGFEEDKFSSFILDHSKIKKLKKVKFRKGKVPKVTSRGVLHGSPSFTEGRSEGTKVLCFDSK